MNRAEHEQSHRGGARKAVDQSDEEWTEGVENSEVGEWFPQPVGWLEIFPVVIFFRAVRVAVDVQERWVRIVVSVIMRVPVGVLMEA